jgi:DNA-binding HxlR family transcriptional regulator
MVGFRNTDDLPMDIRIISVLGELNPLWCRVKNFKFYNSGRRLSPQEVGKVMGMLSRDGIVERRIHPQERIVQYRLTEHGRGAYAKLFDD